MQRPREREHTCLKSCKWFSVCAYVCVVVGAGRQVVEERAPIECKAGEVTV